MPSSVNHCCSIVLSGHTINDLFDLREHFNLQELLALYSSGQLRAFCASQDFVVECRALERLKLMGPLTTLELSIKLCRIFGIARTPLENQCELTAQQLEQDALIIAQRNSQGQLFHQTDLGIAPAQLLPLEPVFTPQIAITNEHNHSFTIKRQLINNIQIASSAQISPPRSTKASDKSTYHSPPISGNCLEEVPQKIRPIRKSWMQKIHDSRTIVPHKIATKDLSAPSYPRYAMFYDEQQSKKALMPTKAALAQFINELLELLQQDPSKIELIKALLINKITRTQQLTSYEHQSWERSAGDFVPAKCHYYYQPTGREFAQPLGEPQSYPQITWCSQTKESCALSALTKPVEIDVSFSQELLSFVLEQHEFAFCQAILQGINTFRFSHKNHQFTDLHYQGILRSANFPSIEPPKRTMYKLNVLLKRKIQSHC